jgi:hypothetical protein
MAFEDVTQVVFVPLDQNDRVLLPVIQLSFTVSLNTGLHRSHHFALGLLELAFVFFHLSENFLIVLISLVELQLFSLVDIGDRLIVFLALKCLVFTFPKKNQIFGR